MPVSSLSSVVFKWPSRDEVLAAARRWARELCARDANVQRVLCFGSAARGDYAFGSDIDLIVIVKTASDSPLERRRLYEPEGLPVDEDLWVYTIEEWQNLPETAPHLWGRLRDESIDLAETT